MLDTSNLTPEQQALIDKAVEALERLRALGTPQMSQHERDRLEYLRLKKIFEPERGQRGCLMCGCEVTDHPKDAYCNKCWLNIINP